ncbi:MAG: hypothetical protein ACOC28_03550, partial [Alkalispirochaetaceae bacterium]
EPPTPEPAPGGEWEPAPPPEPPTPEPAPGGEPWDIPETEEERSSPPPPEPSIDREELRQNIPTGPDAEFQRQQERARQDAFAQLSEELNSIERLQQEVLTERAADSDASRQSANLSALEAQLDEALSDLRRRREDESVLGVTPGEEREQPDPRSDEGPRTRGGRGLVAGSPRPEFSSVRWREGLPGEVVITVRFWVSRQGAVVRHETSPGDLTLLAPSGLREAIDRTVAGWRFEQSSAAAAEELGRVTYVIEM